MAKELKFDPYQRLLSQGLELLEPYKGVMKHHQLRCVMCEHVWSATPTSKFDTYRKYGVSGCPKCNEVARNSRYEESRVRNLELIAERGFEILSPPAAREKTILVRNLVCGHIFTSTPGDILGSGVQCSVCAVKTRIAALNKSTKERSEAWAEDAPAFKVYRSKVTSLTYKTYRNNKERINPNNYPTGTAGTEGAYQIDHIFPVSLGYEYDVPPELLAIPENLQMLPWRDNLSKNGRLLPSQVPQSIMEFVVRKIEEQML